MGDTFSDILFLVFIGGVLVLSISLFFYYNFLRRRAFLEIATLLKFQYYYRSYAIPRRFAFLRQQRRGRGRHASNILWGVHHQMETYIFDYMFSTGMANEKIWHFSSFVVLRHASTCPSLRIYPRSMLEVLGHIVGYEEVFLDIEGFSDSFAVYATQDAFARRICTQPLIEYMMRHLDFSVEVEPGWVAVGKEEKLIPEEIPRRMRQTEKIRSFLAL
ncbi:MAG: hypothetical protein KAH38_11740 [Candidatus Hydrogenedentes bacterium]|nr:hypothetical protein [Candidatus Hydrogenedentota bacterium]